MSPLLFLYSVLWLNKQKFKKSIIMEKTFLIFVVAFLVMMSACKKDVIVDDGPYSCMTSYKTTIAGDYVGQILDSCLAITDNGYVRTDTEIWFPAFHVSNVGKKDSLEVQVTISAGGLILPDDTTFFSVIWRVDSGICVRRGWVMQL